MLIVWSELAQFIIILSMKKKYILFVSIIFSAAIFSILIIPGNPINLIPYGIHENLLPEILPEHFFIIIFDLIISIVLGRILFFIISPNSKIN